MSEFKIRMVQDYSDVCKKGAIFTAKDVQGMPKVYMITSLSAPVYVPKVSAVVIDDDGTAVESEEEKKRTSVFDGVDAPPTGMAMTPEEEAVLASLGSGVSMDSKDGSSIDNGFRPDNEMSIEAKFKKEQEKKFAEARAKLKPHTDPLLQEGQFWLSDLTEGMLPESGVDHIVTCHIQTHWEQDDKGKWVIQIDKSNPWFADMSSADIPEIDFEYLWTADVLECVLLGYKLNEKILLSGPPGTGKTTAIKQYAAWTDHPFMRFNGKDGIEQSSFLGQNTISAGTMKWEDGLMPQGLKGGYIICLDEVFKIPPGIQMALQSLYEREGTLLLDEKPGSVFEKTVFPTPESRVFCTDNVKGTGDASEMFAATQLQDSSTIDRFGLTQDVMYLTEMDERVMLSRKFPTANTKSIKKLVQYANMVREAYMTGKISLTMSPRGLISCLDMITKESIPDRIALNYAYNNKIGDDTEKQILQQFLNSVY